MALTLNTDIANYSLAKNFIPVNIETDSYTQTNGTNANIKIVPGNGNGAAAVGGTMLFEWELDKVLIEIATTPDDSGYQVRPKAALSNAQFAAQLVEDLNKNYILSENFLITLSGTADIVFTAKNSGTKYAIYDNFATSNFGYELFATHSDGTDEVIAANYKMHVDLFIENTFHSDTFSKIAALDLDPFDDKCNFYLEEYLNANLNFHIPDYDDAGIREAEETIKRFYFTYHEKYGSPVVQRIKNTSNYGFVMKAGIPKEDFLQNEHTHISLYYTPNLFLTRQPRAKKVSKEQKEFLYYMVKDKVNGHKRKVVVYYTDGSTHTNYSAVFGDRTYQIWCVPTGYDQINIDSFEPTKTPYKYTVAVVNAATTTNTSEVFTYNIDDDYYQDETFLFFTTSDGGFDTHRCTGIKKTSFEIDSETAQAITLWDNDVKTPEFIEFNNQTQKKFRVSTGFLTKDQCIWLEEFFLSENKFVARVNSDGDYYLCPIISATKSAEQFDSNTNLYAYDIEYSIAFKNITTEKSI